jgi:hypothetical protein
MRDKVRVGYEISGKTVTLLEKRPSYDDPDTWVDIKVAQFRYDPADGEWTLYCADRNSKWQKYLDAEPCKDFEELLIEVDEDPTGIFWG